MATSACCGGHPGGTLGHAGRAPEHPREPFDPESLVFTNERGNPILQSNFRKNIIATAARRAGIQPAPRVHDLRHTAASLMAEAGYSLLEAAEQLGHSSTTMTARYSHAYSEHRQQKVARLDAVLNGSG